MGNLHRVESVLQTPPGAARLLPDPKRADRVFLRIVRDDPLSTPIPWPGDPADSAMDPIGLGQFEDGEPVRFALPGGHVLIGGATGRGKTRVLNVILAELATRSDVVLWGFDMKRGLELAPWRRVLGRLAITDDEALETLTAANRACWTRARPCSPSAESGTGSRRRMRRRCWSWSTSWPSWAPKRWRSSNDWRDSAGRPGSSSSRSPSAHRPKRSADWTRARR